MCERVATTFGTYLIVSETRVPRARENAAAGGEAWSEAGMLVR